jgi:hemoglobin
MVTVTAMSDPPPKQAPKELGSPYEMIGGDEAVRAIVTRFYDRMREEEPALAKLHQLDASGSVSTTTRERFLLFLTQWLGGPMTYSERYGHPRLRMRHAHVKVDTAMRDAWLRCMTKALDDAGVTGHVRDLLQDRFADTADFMRNVPE